MNKSGITPIEDRVLIKVKETEEKTSGGVLLPGGYTERMEMAEMVATVIEVGPLVFDDYPEGEPHPVKAGDVVVMAKYAGLLYTGDDGDKYRIVGMKDIVGVKK